MGESGTDSFTYTVTDEHDAQSTATVTITITGVNDPPVAGDGVYGTNEDTPIGDSLTSHASDPDTSDTLTFSGDSASALGATVTVNADGTFTYDPRLSIALQALLPGQSVVDTFTYTVTDPSGATAGATVTVDVAGVNDNPTAGDDSFSGILEDSSGNVLDVLPNDSTAPDSGETLGIIAVGPTSAGGTVVVNGAVLEYTPKADFFGVETFTYTVEDGNGGTDTATVAVTVTPQNDPPTAANDGYQFIANTGSHVLNVLGNDTIAPDVGEVLTIVSTSPASAGGTVVNQGGQLLYTPAVGFDGTETFTYTISDGNGGTDTATVTVEVIAFVPSSLSGRVYVDADADGVFDPGERGVGGVSVTLTGVDLFATSVYLTTTTADDGSYSFAGLSPGTYTVSEAQPLFLLDGPERIGTQGGQNPANDQLSMVVPLAGGVFGQGNDFTESGMEAQYISIWDFLNTSSRNGILFATDVYTGQLWFSFLDGWSGYSRATAQISADRSTLYVTVVDQASNAYVMSVPFRESATLHIRGSSGTRYLSQLLLSAADFRRVASGGAPPAGAGAPAQAPSPGAAATAAPATSTDVSSELLSAALAAASDAEGGPEEPAAPAASCRIAEDQLAVVDAAFGGTEARDESLAVDAVLSNAGDVGFWGTLSDGLWDQQQGDFYGWDGAAALTLPWEGNSNESAY